MTPQTVKLEDLPPYLDPQKSESKQAVVLQKSALWTGLIYLLFAVKYLNLQKTSVDRSERKFHGKFQTHQTHVDNERRFLPKRL